MKSAQRSIKTYGYWHTPGECNKCKSEFFNAHWGMSLFIKNNKGSNEELTRKFMGWLAQRFGLAKKCNIDLRVMSCIECKYEVESNGDFSQ